MSTFAVTVMSACSGCITSILYKIIEKSCFDPTVSRYDLIKIINSIMSACVGVTASSSNIDFGPAVAIGASSAVIYMLFSKLITKMQLLDDPLEVTIVHGISGYWGCICVGIFDKSKGLIATGSAKQLSIQLIGASTLLLLALFLGGIFFGVLRTFSKLRVGEIFEILGQDVLDRHDMDIKSQRNGKDIHKLNDIDSIVALEKKQRRYFDDLVSRHPKN
jgi:ammonia channel protein AmtB